MRKILLFIVLLIPVLTNAAIIKGSVIDSRGEAMPFVTISVLDKDSSLLTGTITDELGKYSIESPLWGGSGRGS